MEPKNVAPLVNNDSKLKSAKVSGTMRPGNTSKEAQMNKPFKGGNGTKPTNMDR